MMNSHLLPPAQPSRTLGSYLWPRRIGRRLGLGFGSLVVLMLLALLNASAPLRAVTQATEHFASVDMRRLLRVQALSLQIEGVGSALVRLMNAPRDNRVAEYADVDARNRLIDGIIESLNTELHDSTQEQTLQRLTACRTLYAAAFIATVDEVEAEDLVTAAKVLNEQINPSLKAMLAESNALLNRERERIETQLEESQQLMHRIAVTAGAFSVLVVLLAALLAWRITKSVVTPLAQLEAAALRIASGDYATPVLATSAEEVDRVGQALTMMTGAIATRELEIERLAFHDPLTDLPNRTSLLQSGAAPLGAPPQIPACHSLLLFDLARLKVINETLGFGTGDTMIKEVARRAQTVLADFSAPNTRLANVSGGMFAIVFESGEHSLTEQLYQRLVDAMAQPVHCGDHSVDLSLVFGLADSPPGTTTPVIALLRNAEVALDVAKSTAQGFAWYNPAQEAARLSHLGLLSDLRTAVAESQLQMWLQPKFSLQTGAAVGAEALVRWQHPQRGFISPAEFVPFAEQTGAITLITDWMLAQAVRTLQDWQHSHPHLSISVNISTRDLQDPAFFQRVTQLIQAHGTPAHKLRLEIVESGLMQDAHSSIALLQRLRDQGVELSIDDFGTGYSSLAYLQRLPVSELKIDRSFVTDIDTKPGSQQLAKTMIEMGHGMDLLVTAEGIETDAERATLQKLGCDVMQGYFGSRPLFGPALQAWLDKAESKNL